MAGAFDRETITPTKPGAAWIWNAVSKVWEKPAKPTGDKTYDWDDNKGWVEATTTKSNDAGIAGAIGFALTKTLLEDAKYGKGPGGLQEVYDAWIAGDETKALDLYYKSTWYKTLGRVGADRYSMKLNQYDVYLKELDAYKITQKQRLSRVGVKIDDIELNDYLTKAYDGAFSDGQLDALIVKSSSFGTKFAGDTLTKIQNFREYANSFGMSYDDKKYSQWGADLFSGKITDSEIEQNIRTEAASAFPGFSDQIMKGVTLDALSSAYKNTMATIFEVDVDSIGYNDNTLRRALQYVGPDGKPAYYPLWQFEKDLKTDPRWGQTKNARDTMDSLSLKVLRDMGMA